MASKWASRLQNWLEAVNWALTYILRHIAWKLQVAYWTTAMLSEIFFVWFRAAWEIRLESYGPRHTSVVLWYNIVCICCKPIYIAIWCSCNYTQQQNSRILWLDTRHQTMDLLPRMHPFIEQNWLATLHVVVSVQLIVYSNITTIYTALWICCQAARKKEDKLRVEYFL